MARRRQSSSGFNTSGFDGVEMSVDLGEAIDRWREQFVATVGMTDKNRSLAKYRRAAGWAVDEVAKTAVQNIRYRFYLTMKKHTSWTNSAVAYKRLSKEDLNGLERGERRVEDIYAQVFVKPNQSAYLKYLFGMGDNVRLPGDVGLASRHILIPWWQNITLTQGVRPTANGNVPRSFLARLARQAEGKVAKKGSAASKSRWGVYYGRIKLHGVEREAWIARPPRVPVTEQDVLHRGHSALDRVIATRGGDVRRIGRELRDIDHPRNLFLAVDRATYTPTLQKPWDEACRHAASRIPEITNTQFDKNLAHNMLKGTYLLWGRRGGTARPTTWGTAASRIRRAGGRFWGQQEPPQCSRRSPPPRSNPRPNTETPPGSAPG